MRTGTCCLLQGPHWREKHLQPAWSSGCCQGPPGATCTSVVPSGSFGTLSLPVLPAPFLADGQARTSTGATLMGRRGHTRWVCAEPHRPWCLDRAGEGHQGVSWAPPHLHRAPPHPVQPLLSLWHPPGSSAKAPSSDVCFHWRRHSAAHFSSQTPWSRC